MDGVNNKNSPKLGQRIVRAFMYGLMMGFVLFLMGYMFMWAMNTVGNTNIMQPLVMGIVGWLTGFGAAFGIELSKDLE